MKIIFSPTKTLKKLENNYGSSIPNNLEITNKINNELNVIKEDKHQAIFYYNGISFKYLDVTSLNIDYLNEHLIILSALYGDLRPLDLINEYRLDFTDKSLYKYWNIDYKDELVINLASKEYSKMIKSNNMITIDFKEYKNNKLTTSGTYNKMLRGLILRYMTINKITDISLLKEFSELDYSFNESLSNNNLFVFTKGEVL
ncbi:MAG: peroxide stress protein YaaA [bacterium]